MYYFKLDAWPSLPSRESVAEVIVRIHNAEECSGHPPVVVRGTVVISSGGLFPALHEYVTESCDPSGRRMFVFKQSRSRQQVWTLDDGTGQALPLRNCRSPELWSQEEMDHGRPHRRRHGATAMLDSILGLFGESRFEQPEERLELLEGFGRKPCSLSPGQQVTLVGYPVLPDGFTTLFIDGLAFVERAPGWLITLDPVTLFLLGLYAAQNPKWATTLGLTFLSALSCVRAARAWAFDAD